MWRYSHLTHWLWSNHKRPMNYRQTCSLFLIVPWWLRRAELWIFSIGLTWDSQGRATATARTNIWKKVFNLIYVLGRPGTANLLFNLHLKTLTIKYYCDNLKVVPHLEHGNDTINHWKYYSIIHVQMNVSLFQNIWIIPIWI